LDDSRNDTKQVTQLLARWKNGDSAAEEVLTPLLYNELHKLARRYLQDERAAATLQPTALVSELYLRLIGQEHPDWQSRSHFFGVAAHRMRQILVEHARKHRAGKRGGGVANVELNEMLCFAPGKSAEVLALDDALNALARFDERKAKVIELRFFAGLSVEETAQALDISVATVGREQRMAEAWLKREMSGVK
jgi:RNA polymerase sigma factor (TIGR02999 family)